MKTSKTPIPTNNITAKNDKYQPKQHTTCGENKNNQENTTKAVLRSILQNVTNIATKSRYAHTANKMLSTVSLNAQKQIKWEILNLGAMSHYLVANAPCKNKKRGNTIN